MEITSIETSTFERMNRAVGNLVEKISRAQNGKCGSLTDWLDNQDVCLMLNISPRKLLTLRQRGSIPFSRIDRKIFYHHNDILHFIQNELVKTTT